MPAPKGNNQGRKFSATIQPTKRGRKKSLYSEFVKEFKMRGKNNEISKEDTIRLLRYILNCSRAEFEQMGRNKHLPIHILSQIQAIAAEIKQGKTDTVDKIFDLVYGKAPHVMQVTGVQGSSLIPDIPISRLEYEELLNELQYGLDK